MLVESEDAYDLQITGPITFHSDGKITIEAGGDVTVKAGGKVYVGNNAMDINTLLKAMSTGIQNIQTFGAPAIHKIHPTSLAEWKQIDTKIDALTKPGA